MATYSYLVAINHIVDNFKLSGSGVSACVGPVMRDNLCVSKFFFVKRLLVDYN